MPNSIDFNVSLSDNARELAFVETTGNYSNSNTGGYGSPNITLSAFTTSTLVITDPDEDNHTIQMIPNGFPTNDKTKELNIRTQHLGLGTDQRFKDGKWIFLYTISDGTNTFTSKQTILLSGNARCCVFDLLSKASIDCSCNSNSLARALEAYTFYRMAIVAALNANSTKHEEILSIIENYCNSKCGTCK